MKTLGCLLLAWMILGSSVWADPSADRASDFPAVVSALRQGDNQAALVDCLRLEKAGQASFGSLYNAGLALRNLGDLPRARASFERALLLQPNNLATRRRLREIESQLGSKVATGDVRGTPWWRKDQAELLIGLPGLILLALIMLAGLKGKRTAPTAILLLIATGLGLSLFVVLTAPAEERAIVVDTSAQLLPEAKPDKPGEVVPAGLMVEVLERQNHYAKIATGEGKTGWVRAAQLGDLSLPTQATPAVQR